MDSGATQVFGPLIAAANAARKKIAAEGKAGAEEYVGGYRDAPRRLKKGFDETTQAAEKSAAAQAKAAEKAAKEQIRAFDHVWKIKQRYLEQEERAQEQSLRRRAAMISRAGQNFGGLVSRGAGLLGSVARGAGVDLDVGSIVSRNVKTQATATDIAASSYVEGAAGSVGVRQDPKRIIAAARDAADAAAISTDVALAGLQKFVGKSTDLETGLQVLKAMAIQSKATGSNLEDVLDAAGDIDVKLADTPDKAQILAGIMSTVAKQGQLGASELRSMAPVIGRIVSSSNQFASGPAKAAQELGTMFQITKKLQGMTPAQAATSVQRFVSDLTSKSGLKALHGMGIKDEDLFADKGKTMLRDPSKIIPLLLEKSGGDLTKIAKELPNVKSGAVLKAFSNIYSEGEKGGKGGGAKAVAATFAEFGGAMSEKQISDSLGRALDTTQSKVQLFNNQLDRIAEANLPKVMNALEQLAPHVADAAEAFAKVAGWAAENPGKTIVAALVASIGKAGAEGAISKALAAAVGGKNGLAISSAVIGITAATLVYKHVQSEKKGGAESVFEDVSRAGKDIEGARAEKKKGGISADTREKLEHEREALASDLALGARGDLTKRRLQSINPFSDTTFADVGRQEGAQDAGFRGDAAARIQEINALLAQGADNHAKAADSMNTAAVAAKNAADAWKKVGGFAGAGAPGSRSGPGDPRSP